MDIINWLIANYHITLPIVVALLYLIVINTGTKKDDRIFWKLYNWLKLHGIKLPRLTKKDE